jgi:SAM-dependent methyltransferase
MGLTVVGVDITAAAIGKAELKARDRSLGVRFVVGDALDRASMERLGRFDTVLDCGVFHIFEDDDRALFVDNLAAVIPAGGRYFMLCFSELQPGDWGPRRVTESEIRASFGDGWRIDTIEASRLVVTFLPDGVHAWRSAVTRL